MTATVLSMPEAATAPTVTLRQRIADALTKPTTSTEVRACIAHAQAALGGVERDRKRAEAKAVDPLSTEEEATEGKRECEALRFDLDRLTASEARLKARLEAVTDDEDQAGRRKQYEAAVKARDEAAETLRTVYPRASAEIQDALLMLAEAEAKVVAANRNLPTGAEHLLGAEATAVGVKVVNGMDGVWPLTPGVKLPARFGATSWPAGW